MTSRFILFELNKSKSSDAAWLNNEFAKLSESDLLPEPCGVVIRVAAAEDAAVIAQHDKHTLY